MKKQLLFTTSIFVSGLLCAQVANKVSRIPSNLANISVLKSSNVEDKIVNSGLPYQTKAQIATPKNSQRVSTQTESIIGNTFYDLQSNSSVGDRIVVNADGTIATCWTFEGTADGGVYTNRGTGYAYYNGSTWSAAPAVRVENVRVGWGNIANTRSGKELILSHYGTGKVLNLASRATKGTGVWANSTTAIPNANAGGNFWPRMVTSSVGGGDTVYAISVTSNAAGGGTSFNGLDGAVCFHRSLNAGATWDIANQIPAGLTSATFRGFGGDSYAIAAKGSTVVVVAGDMAKDLVMSKSTDAGATWTAKTVLKFPIALYNSATMTTDSNADGVADTLYTNDGNLAIGLDNNGVAFVSYGRMRVLCTSPGTGTGQGLSYFPYTDGLYLWNENMPQDAGGNMVAAIEDLYEQGTIYFPTAPTGENAFGSFGCSLTSYPNLAFDANNTLYLSYCSIVDSLISVTSSTKLLRHAFVIKSCDGGVNFTNPYDVVPSLAGGDSEGMFASMAKNVNGNIHLIYQRDFYPGYGVPPSSGTNPDADNVDNSNDIVYVSIPVADLGSCPTTVTGIKDQSTMFEALNFYPNPASTNATIDVVLNENAKLDISVLNSVGQTVYSTSISGNTGSNKVNINLNNLSAGLYFYQVKVGNSKAITKKFAVEK
jgi:hypothetical protein